MLRLKRLLGAFSLLVALGLLQPSTAAATVIRFQATDLVDVVAGQDLWIYEYFVSDRVFSVDQGFVILFAPLLYANLRNQVPAPGPAVGVDWDVIVFQPDSTLPANGAYDALALVNGASLSQPFSVDFTWLGGPGSNPGSQRFEVYELDGDTPVTFDSGQTSPIPEPSTLLLMGSGMALALKRRRGSRRATVDRMT